MPWYTVQPYGTPTLNENYVRNLYAPLVAKLKELGVIDSADNGTWTYPAVKYKTKFTLGGQQYYLGFGINVYNPYTPQIFLYHDINQITNLTTTSSYVPSHITFYQDLNYAIIGFYSNSTYYTSPLIIWWDKTPYSAGNGVEVGPIYVSVLNSTATVYTGVANNGVAINPTGAIVHGQLVIPTLSLIHANIVGVNEKGLASPMRKGIIYIKPGYKEVAEFTNRLYFIYTSSPISTTEPLPGYFNINGGSAGNRWVLLGETTP